MIGSLMTTFHHILIDTSLFSSPFPCFSTQVAGSWKTKHQGMAKLCGEARRLKDKFLSFQISHVLRVTIVFVPNGSYRLIQDNVYIPLIDSRALVIKVLAAAFFLFPHKFLTFSSHIWKNLNSEADAQATLAVGLAGEAYIIT